MQLGGGVEFVPGLVIDFVAEVGEEVVGSELVVHAEVAGGRVDSEQEAAVVLYVVGKGSPGLGEESVLAGPIVVMQPRRHRR